MAVCDTVDSQEDLLAKAISEWEGAQYLFAAPAWNGQPLARHFAELLRGHADLEARLVELFSHRSQLVSAYSLLTLDLMDSRELEHLPGSLLERREKITKLMGSFADKMELGAFARQMQKGWRERHRAT